jgi:lipopolysaccharide biosynthesis glycosyltransferase
MKCACTFSLDDAYVIPFKVFFHSLIATKSIPEPTPIFILHTAALSPSSIQDLEIYLSLYGRTASFLDATSVFSTDLPLREGAYSSQATYYRLFIAEMLPDDVTHVVYLDCDMIAINSIRDLFEFEYSTPIAAVDQLSPWQSVRLWGDAGGPYFQAGLILASLKYWRDNHLSSLFISIAKENKDRLFCDDQDVLNIAFQHNWTPLPIGFNVEEGAIKSLSCKWIRDNIRIAHFSGPSKPWNSYNASPYLVYWDQAYKEVFGSPFNRNRFKPSFSLRAYIKKVARAILGR